MPTFQEAYHTVSQQDHQRIIRISKAVKPLVEPAFGRLASGDLVIALTQCHGGVCPLDLERMESDVVANNGVGALHDVAGIYRHIDRDTGELTGCFLPRYALPGKGDE
jgi:hypothetical protein